MKKFPWGTVVDRFEYDFNGEIVSVVKYHPHKVNGSTVTREVCENSVMFSCEEIHESSDCVEYLVISWIAYKRLGLNNRSLAEGIAKALELF